MKRFSVSLASAALLAAALAPAAVAQPIDSFLLGGDASAGQYSVDTALIGQNADIVGWTGPWLEGCCGGPTVVSGGLTYPNLPVDGGAIEFSTSQTSGRVGRLLGAPITGDSSSTLYLSFLMQASDAVNGSQITYGGLEIHEGGFDDGGNRRVQIVAGEGFQNGGQTPNYTLRMFGNQDAQFNADLGPNNGETNLFVLRFDMSDQDNGDALSVFRNPDLSSGVEPSTADFTTSGFNLGFDRTSFARFGDSGVFTYDELRTGPTYESVTAAVDPFLPGDTNGNFIVEFEEDFGPIRDNWLETNASFGMALARSDGDLNLNGSVGIEDFREWKDAFLDAGGSNAQVAAALASLGAVPEPGTLLLSAALAVGLCGCRRGRA